MNNVDRELENIKRELIITRYQILNGKFNSRYIFNMDNYNDEIFNRLFLGDNIYFELNTYQLIDLDL